MSIDFPTGVILKKNKLSLSLSLSIAMIALAACSNPKDANKENFGKAIQAYLDTKPALCLYVSSVRFPFSTPAKGFDKDSSAEQLNALVNAGLVTRKEQEIKNENPWGIDRDKKMVPGIVFEVSEEGKKYFGQEKGLWGTRDEFCTGKWELAGVDNFSEPADMMGATISQVNYRRTMVDADDWANSEELAAAFPGAFHSVKGEVETQDILVLANDGWIHERLFQKR